MAVIMTPTAVKGAELEAAGEGGAVTLDPARAYA